MGTRHLTAVVIDGQFKVAQYGQWDGYPSCAGLNVLEFLRDTNLEDFAGAVRNCTFLSEDEIKARWAEAGSDGTGWVTSKVADKFAAKHPQLYRDIGSEVLQLILENDGLELSDSRDFAGDSLCCEWAYVIDLDHMQFEIYEGFNQEPPLGRFADLAQEGEEYKPVTLIKTYDLDDLPTLEAFPGEFCEDV